MVPQITPLSHGVSRCESHGHETGLVSRSHGGIPLKGDIHPHETTEREDKSPLNQSQGHHETNSQVKILAPKLPSIEELQPQIDKLAAHPGSVILIAVTLPTAESGMQIQNYHEVGTAWFSKAEADSLRSALQRAKLKRSKALANLAKQKQGQDSGQA